jgi:hypothetical protein
MEVTALITWLITALGGFYMLGTWISRGGLAPGSTSRLPKPVLFGHFLLAAIGLVVGSSTLRQTVTRSPGRHSSCSFPWRCSA